MYCVPWYLSKATVSLHDPVFEKDPCMKGVDPQLEQLKSMVGVYKIRHGDVRWKANVEKVDRTISFSDPADRPISRAYYKLLEIIRTSSIKPPRTVLHLCEAPGGFAQAVAHEFPDAVMNVMSRRDEGSINFSPALKQYKRIDMMKLAHNGNILLKEVRDELVSLIQDAELITADGGIDNDDKPELTENATAHLILCEIDAAVRLQQEGGTFVLKIFSFSRNITKQLIAILTTCYKEVTILKPFTSRSVNDERYIVCSGFERAKAPHLNIPDITQGPFLNRIANVDDRWMQEAEQISNQMTRDQRQSISDALTCTSSDERSHSSDRQRVPRGQMRGRGHPYSSRGRGRQRTHTFSPESTT